MDRQHRRDLKHDRFVDEIGSLSQRARDNQRFLLTITLAVVGVAVVGYGIYFYRANREEKAQKTLAAAIEVIDSPLITSTSPGQPPAPNAKFKTAKERTDAAQKQFNDLKKNDSGTDAADLADVYLARLAAGRGDTAGARKLLEGFISDHPKSVLVGPARYSLYQIRIENGEAQQVITELESEMKKESPGLPSDTILALEAHAYEAQGKSDKSKELYRRLITEFPDSSYAIDAQRRVGPA
jgi:TolA-binding protein